MDIEKIEWGSIVLVINDFMNENHSFPFWKKKDEWSGKVGNNCFTMFWFLKDIIHFQNILLEKKMFEVFKWLDKTNWEKIILHKNIFCEPRVQSVNFALYL